MRRQAARGMPGIGDRHFHAAVRAGGPYTAVLRTERAVAGARRDLFWHAAPVKGEREVSAMATT